MSVTIYDSSKKTKVTFEPIEKGVAKIYVCGPTVYDDAHLGHARSAIAFDLLHRVLKANDYEVIMTKNFTDIDDKIIKKMNESNSSLEDITNEYINSYKSDMKTLNVLDNTLEPKATQNLEAMKDMVEKLLQNGVAYSISDGVYFNVDKDSDYGNLSHRVSEENLQNRVDENSEKKNQKDFALWKFAKEGEISFEAPFGTGRPGWHLECSAMIDKHLAYKDGDYQIDIHAGGADLIFPHHENECAQTRCATNKNLAKYWMHNGFVNIDGEKMSKSLGNSFFLKDVLKSYSGEVIRFYLISAHYRANFNFNEEDLISSKKRLDRLYRLKKRVYGGSAGNINKDFKESILKALNDDLNTSIALSIVDDFVTQMNEKLDNEPKNKALKKEIIANIDFISSVLGIGSLDAYEYFQFGIDSETKNKILELIEQRATAKKEKNFELSDKIRDELSSMQIAIMDTPQGTIWEKAN